MSEPRVLGVDHGDRRTGLAVSDPLGITAQPVGVVREKSAPKALARVAEVARERGVVRVIVGLPLNMDGTEGPRARIARAFGEKLAEATGVAVEFYDERLTSVQAERALKGQPKQFIKDHADVVAAQILLQSYLDRRGR